MITVTKADLARMKLARIDCEILGHDAEGNTIVNVLWELGQAEKFKEKWERVFPPLDAPPEPRDETKP